MASPPTTVSTKALRACPQKSALVGASLATGVSRRVVNSRSGYRLDKSFYAAGRRCDGCRMSTLEGGNGQIHLDGTSVTPAASEVGKNANTVTFKKKQAAAANAMRDEICDVISKI